MKTKTRGKILDYINSHGQARAYDLQKALEISNVAIHKQLRKLLDDKLLKREGTPPLVFYSLPSEVSLKTKVEELPKETKAIIEENFLSITPYGKLLFGEEGFFYWANNYQSKKPPETIAYEYLMLIKQQRRNFTKEGWIDATFRLKDSFKEVFIDHLLFEDIYSYKIFGRTKLAKLTMYAKQTGAKGLIDKISVSARPLVERIIKKYSVEAVVFIPPTVPRPLQFMDEFESKLNLPLPVIELVKVVPGDIPIPQKTLSTLEERVINARSSIYLKNTEEKHYGNILLIDDVVGSGASFNESARKLKLAQIGNKRIIAFALVGNLKGYDVVREI